MSIDLIKDEELNFLSKKRSKVDYYDIKFYIDELYRAKKMQENFEVVKTTYTKKITTPNEKMIFNEGAKSDNNLMILISQVRKDAAEFMKDFNEEEVSERIDFFNLLNIVKNDEVLVKVDVKSAYWEMAIKKGVITKETDEKFKLIFQNFINEYVKECRLKALGSLATTKHFQWYKKGKLFDEDIITEPTKHIYMYICDCVDRLMKEINESVDGCKYYYWDCMFVSQKFAPDAVKFLSEQGFSSTSEETSVKRVNVGDIGYILSKTDNKSYMIRRENDHLLEDLWKS